MFGKLVNAIIVYFQIDTLKLILVKILHFVLTNLFTAHGLENFLQLHP